MMNFKFSYDEDNDDLFTYLEGKKSKGAVELGNFVLDFDEKGNLVAMEIIDASKTVAQLMSKVVELTKIKEMRVEIANMRNIVSIKFNIITDSGVSSANMLIPRIKEKSPVLSY